MKRKIFESQEGQSLILIALMMVALVGMLGLALDGGRAFAARRASQNAADSAAFGAVRLLATKSVTATEPMIWDTITKFAKANDVVTTTNILAYFIDASSRNICRIPTCGGIPTNATGVRVTTTLQLQPYFIDVLIGKQTIPIPAVAAAQSGSPTLARELAPVVIPYPWWCTYPPTEESQCFQYGDLVTLEGIGQAPGNVQWVDYSCGSSGSGVTALTQYFAIPPPQIGPVAADPGDQYYSPTIDYSHMAPPSPWICSFTGNKNSENIAAAVAQWLGKSWLVPIYNHNNSGQGGVLEYHVAMFADFVPMGYDFGNGQDKSGGDHSSCTTHFCIEGMFEQYTGDLEIMPGPCNLNGLDVCGIGMSQ